ncbi:PTS sugar transporter subunit IIC, partial [Streptococcus pyogenes]
TVPSIFAALIATASIRGALLVVVNFSVYLGIYYPFFKAYERKLALQEGKEAAGDAPAVALENELMEESAS